MSHLWQYASCEKGQKSPLLHEQGMLLQRGTARGSQNGILILKTPCERVSAIEQHEFEYKQKRTENFTVLCPLFVSMAFVGINNNEKRWLIASRSICVTFCSRLFHIIIWTALAFYRVM